MVDILKEINSVSFDKAKTIVGASYFTNKNRNVWLVMIVYAFCIFLSFLPLQNSIFITIALIFLNSMLLIGFLVLRQGRRYLDKTSIRITIYLLAQITIFSLPLGLRDEGGPLYGKYYFLISFIYIVLSLAIVYWRAKRLIITYAYDQKLSKTKKINSKVDKTFGYILAGSLTAILVGMQIYRITKFYWINGNIKNYSFQTDNIGLIILILTIYLILALIFALLPMVLFDEKLIIFGTIVKKNSEQFRKEYDFTPIEWYGEKWSE